MSSLSSWRVESNWLNFQLSWIALNWKYEQFDSNWVENVSNLTQSQFEFKMLTQNSTWQSVYYEFELKTFKKSCEFAQLTQKATIQIE